MEIHGEIKNRQLTGSKLFDKNVIKRVLGTLIDTYSKFAKRALEKSFVYAEFYMFDCLLITNKNLSFHGHRRDNYYQPSVIFIEVSQTIEG